MEFRIVVWNLKGLSLASDPLRLQRAENAFRILAEDKDTAVFALVELGEDAILEHLADKMGSQWEHFRGVTQVDNSGMGLLLDTKRLSAITVALTTAPHDPNTGKLLTTGSRTQATVFQIYHEHVPRFLLALVHFKAERGGSEAYTRCCQAEWFRGELEGLFSDTKLPVVIVGDFNGEPHEPMFGETGFRAFRRIDATLRSNDSLKIYNPMWRLLGDPNTVPALCANQSNQIRIPYGTFPENVWHSLIDGILVSGEWLQGNGYLLHDDRLEILTNNLWHHIGKKGAHHAYAANATEGETITDHLPIAVNLEII